MGELEYLFLSSDIIEIQLQIQNIPTASVIKSFFKKVKREIYFAEYWGNKLSVIKIKSNLHGINIIDINSKFAAGIQMQIEDYQEYVIWNLENFSDDNTNFDLLIYEFLPKLNFEKISCGKMSFTQIEWSEAIENGSITNIRRESTIET